MEDNNNRGIEELFSLLGKQESQFAAMYRNIAAGFGLSETEMWIYYMMLIHTDGVTQQIISRQLSYKKQTVNSAVAKLVRKGTLMLTDNSENNRSKIVRLTEKGQEFVEKTVKVLLTTEMKAAKKFGKRKLESLCNLQEEYFRTLK